MVNHPNRSTRRAKFADTAEGEAFIATAASRETSPEIMRAIAFFAQNLAEAEAVWSGDGLGAVCHASDIWEHVTGNGQLDATEFCWGAAGIRWWAELNS